MPLAKLGNAIAYALAVAPKCLAQLGGSSRGPKLSVREGKTKGLGVKQARQLLESIDVTTPVGRSVCETAHSSRRSRPHA